MRNVNDTKVFVSYASPDKLLAELLIKNLTENGLDVINVSDMPIQAYNATDLKMKLEKQITSGDYFLPIISSNYIYSNWGNYELTTAISHELNTRAITIIPVVIEKCSIPEVLNQFQVVDLSTGNGEGIHKIVDTMKRVKLLDFSTLTPLDFEKLVYDLLETLGFESINKNKATMDLGIDFTATYTSKDPFAIPVKQKWLVQSKLYQKSRVSVSEIHRLVTTIDSFHSKTNVLLVTNSNLTSLALDQINKSVETHNIYIRVVEGTELRRLLLSYPKLVDKYFQDRGQSNECID